MMKALISAELLKLRRQPAVLFWCFLAAPVSVLGLRIAFESVMFMRFGELPQGSTDFAISAARALGIAGNPISQLLYAIGVSTVFFSEYRYSTWRNLVPRGGRFPPLIAKCAACLLCTIVALALTAAGDVCFNATLSFVAGDIQDQQATAPDGGRVLAASFAVALLELSALGLTVATITIAFRSMTAAIVPVFIVAVGAWVLHAYLGQAVLLLPLPSLAADAVRAWLFDGADGRFAVAGVTTLLAWCVAAAGIGGALFWRQPLASE